MSDAAIVHSDGSGNIVYRASALGGCLRALLAARLEYEPMPTPERMQKVFNAGHDAEEVAVAALGERGYKLIDRQMPVRLPITGTILVEGHIDGHFVVGARPESVAEIKSQSQDEWDAYEAGRPSGLWTAKYPWQFGVYAHAARLPLDVVRINRDRPEQMVIQRWEPLIELDKIRARVLSVEAAARKGDLDAVECSGGWPCPYYYLHDEPELVEEVAVDVLARQYKTGKRIEAIGQQKAEIARGQLRELIPRVQPEAVKDGLPKIETQGGSKVTFFMQHRTRRIEGKNDPNDPFKLEAEWEQVKVTLKKNGEG